jgi:hypothetical protein
MSRLLNLLFTLGVLSFWVLMNTSLVLREFEIRNLGLYQRGVNYFLGDELSRESWLGIYKDGRKVGYTGFSIERLFEDDGIRHVSMFDTMVRFELLGKPVLMELDGTMLSDLHMVPEELHLRVSLGDGTLEIDIDGVRRGEFLALSISRMGNTLVEQELPLSELSLRNGFALDLPVAGLEPGQTYELPVFDPVSQFRGPATVTVTKETTLKVQGVPVDCFHVETKFMGLVYDSWVTPEGETLRQDIPPPLGYTLISESKDRAQGEFLGPRHRRPVPSRRDAPPPADR